VSTLAAAETSGAAAAGPSSVPRWPGDWRLL